MKNVDDLYNAIAKRYLNVSIEVSGRDVGSLGPTYEIYIDLMREDKISGWPYVCITIIPYHKLYILSPYLEKEIVLDHRYIIDDMEMDKIIKQISKEYSEEYIDIIKTEYLFRIIDRLCLFSILVYDRTTLDECCISNEYRGTNIENFCANYANKINRMMRHDYRK